MNLKKLIYTAFLAAIICVFSPWAIPIGPIPISLATLSIYCAAALSDWKSSILSVLIYIIIGLIGLPVFSSFTGGVQVIAGPTGGYIIGYLPCALIISLFTYHHNQQKWVYPVSMLLGTLFCYTIGTIWYILQSNISFFIALKLCVLPFIPFDIIKIIIASIIAYNIHPLIKKYL